jgi:hypothetical protein
VALEVCESRYGEGLQGLAEALKAGEVLCLTAYLERYVHAVYVHRPDRTMYDGGVLYICWGDLCMAVSEREEEEEEGGEGEKGKKAVIWILSLRSDRSL